MGKVDHVQFYTAVQMELVGFPGSGEDYIVENGGCWDDIYRPREEVARRRQERRESAQRWKQHWDSIPDGMLGQPAVPASTLSVHSEEARHIDEADTSSGCMWLVVLTGVVFGCALLYMLWFTG